MKLTMATLFLALLVCSSVSAADFLKVDRVIPLPGVKGRMDHLTLDATGKRLWVAALENNTVEVIDLEAGKRIKSIEGVDEPQGVALWGEANRILVASGGDGMLRAFDDSFAVTASIKGLDDADNVRFDPIAKQAFVAFGNGAIAIVDVDSFKKVAEVKLAAHPESFQREQKGRRIFANVPKAGHIAVVDRNKIAVIATWPVTGAQSNFPMALDEAARRLFVACRKPARLLVFDLDTGKQVATRDCCGDADDVFYDALTKRIYVSGGEGCISVISHAGGDEYPELGRVPTAPGARTSLFVSETKTLYLAVPNRDGQPAAIWAMREP